MASALTKEQSLTSFILARITWNSIGFAAAVVVASAAAVTSLLVFDSPASILSEPLFPLLDSWFNLFVMGCFYTSTMALIPSAIFLTLLEWANVRELAVYIFAGVVVSVAAHISLLLLGVNMLASPPIVMSSMIGGACGACVLWRIIR